MQHDLPIGQALRRFRRLNGVKQGDIAERLSVSQGSVSRWESGAQVPDAGHRDRIAEIVAASATSAGDAAIKRLVSTSSLPVHLVCDATHRLLAASPARAASWNVDVASYLGSSLWRFASDEIMAAEEGLAAIGWFERPCQRLRFATAGNASDEIPVAPGIMQWETIPLSDGRVGRLTTTIAIHA
ncbi:helix-turn-helix domain-containing protein [Sphingomonas psychrotolerans]|uniref:Helix-turn-helix domain-containing protein n=1 Tax=Sphingomonas psychrotolerans TaxID=1327635 RepID=A0ABU3N4I9_9SPHN|nr:helix-turn-helix transcriptional regulator [Sphingomonas psychrotolerans]MDT8758784.1 helix-turn-helix domain-containing protein [Sphingomonas psychrotolerans]